MVALSPSLAHEAFACAVCRFKTIFPFVALKQSQ